MTHEREIHVPKGWVMLPVVIALFAVAIALEVWFGFTVRSGRWKCRSCPISGSWAAVY